MKLGLRSSFLAKRRQLKKERLKQAGYQIAELLFALKAFKSAQTIASYVDFDNEVPTRFIIKRALALTKKVGVPCMNEKKQTVSFYSIQSLQELKPNQKRIFEPSTANPELKPEQIELILVPGIAFDEKGYRLGFGKGYFDKCLTALNHATKIGLGFEWQVIKELPREKHDVAVDMLISEKRVRNF